MTGHGESRKTRREVLPINKRRILCLKAFPRVPITMLSTPSSLAAFTISSAGTPTRCSHSIRSGAIPCSCKAVRSIHGERAALGAKGSYQLLAKYAYSSYPSCCSGCLSGVSVPRYGTLLASKLIPGTVEVQTHFSAYFLLR